jgi:N-acetylglucosaminyl-diphospho-decaprenol L-rhamnosyltransferase
LFDIIFTIINHNHKEMTIDCLRSIKDNVRDIDYKVVVLDNASTDNSSRVIPKLFPDVIYIKQKVIKGFRANQNRILKSFFGKARYYILLNDDTVVLKDSINKMFQFMEENSDVGICGARLIFPDGKYQISGGIFPSMVKEIIRLLNLKAWGLSSDLKGFIGKYFGYLLPYEFREYLRVFIDENGVREVDYVSGACMMVRHRVFEQIGFLNGDYEMYAEDIDLCFRAKLDDWKIYLHNEAKVVHKLSMNMSSFAVEQFEISKVKFFKNYYKNKPLFFYKVTVSLITFMKGILSQVEGLSNISAADFSVSKKIWLV